MWTVVGLFAVFLAAQLVPVTRVNPPVETEAPAPPDVKAVLRRACYDCHSNETVWPWYSYVAPVSWLVADDVNHGRQHLNFSMWNRVKPEHLQKLMHDAWWEVEHDEMPLWYYLPMHPAARLSDADKALLRSWMQPSPARRP